jgi:dienelactone hydrolase
MKTRNVTASSSFAIAFGLLLVVSRLPLDAQSPVVREDDIPYAQRGDLILKLDLARPAGEGPFPALVYIIDDWAHEDTTLDRKSLEHDIPEAVKRGYAAVAFDRRLVITTDNNKVKYPFPAPINDAKSAVRWLRSHAAAYKIDSDRIGAIGVSSGGYLALLLGLTGPSDGLEGEGDDLSISSRVQAVVNISGPTELVSLWKEGGMKGSLEDLLGGSPDQAPEKYELANPLSHVRPDAPPILTIHGDQDVRVPIDQAEMLDAKMKEVGASHTLVVRRGQGHANFMRTSAVRGIIFDFFDKWLKKG